MFEDLQGHFKGRANQEKTELSREKIMGRKIGPMVSVCGAEPTPSQAEPISSIVLDLCYLVFSFLTDLLKN